MKKYMVILNESLTRENLENRLNRLAEENWKPILLSAAHAAREAPISLAVILEEVK